MNVLSVVRSIEVVRISEVENTLYIIMEIAVGATACVRYLEVVRFSEGPLIEVLLYYEYLTCIMAAMCLYVPLLGQ